MTVLPVIERELRAQSRLAFTYLVRVLGATVVIFACVWFGFTYGFAPRMGPILFGWLNCALVVAIWVLAPLICADCISRERREGTVGLLFLTPLRAREIVLAKGLVHGIRSMSLLLSVLPVVTISFLLGGVTWREAVLSALVNFSCVCWALAAGLLASSVSKSWLRSMLLASGLALCFAAVLILLTGWRVIVAVKHDPGVVLPFPYTNWRWQLALSYNYYQVALPVGFFSITDFEGFWGHMFGSLKPATQRAWLMEEMKIVVISMMALLTAILIAAWNLRRVWQEEPPSARRQWIAKQLCSPIIGVAFLHRWLGRKLERNPIGWLEQRTWSGRLVTWGWFAVMVSFYSAASSAQNVWHLLAAVQVAMAWMLLVIMASTAAGSFQRERETRVLELLLISPMSAGQIISGRLRGIWGQFAPAFALLLAVWIYLAGVFWENDFTMVPFFCGAFLTVPVVGLYYSLKQKHFISSLLWTLWTGILLPFVLKWLLFVALNLLNFFEFSGVWPFGREDLAVMPFVVVIIQTIIAARIGRELHRNLQTRKFAFSTAAG